jgi:hypothetical protein
MAQLTRLPRPTFDTTHDIAGVRDGMTSVNNKLARAGARNVSCGQGARVVERFYTAVVF